MMLRLHRTCVLLFSAVLLGPGCGDREQPSEERKPEFGDIQAAPSNKPLHSVSITETKKEAVPLLPGQGVAPLVRIMRTGKMMEGEHRIKGSVTQKTAQEIRFVPNEGSEISIGVLLPAGMRLTMSDNEGTLYVNDKSSLRGAEQTMTLLTMKGLVIGSIWRVDSKPISFTPVPGVVIAQTALQKESTENILQPVDVSVTTNEGKKIVPLGKTYSFGMGGKKYILFVNTSHFQASTDEGDDVRRGYILRGMIVEEW